MNVDGTCNEEKVTHDVKEYSDDDKRLYSNG
jgi:hypothetical protein